MRRFHYAFCGNVMYNSESIHLVKWWSWPFIKSAMIIHAECRVSAKSEREARKIAKAEFEEIGLYEQVMGDRL